jgi:hypothetical protein
MVVSGVGLQLRGNGEVEGSIVVHLSVTSNSGLEFGLEGVLLLVGTGGFVGEGPHFYSLF